MDNDKKSVQPKLTSEPNPTSQPSPLSETMPRRTRSNSYDPYENRVVEVPNGDIRSLANLVKASLGTGILAMPLAFSNAGWLVGLVGTAILAFICYHCVVIFVQTAHGCCKLERKPLLGYADTCRFGFKHGPKCVSNLDRAAFVFAESSMFLTYIGICCIYTVLLADSLKQVFDKYIFTDGLSITYYFLIIILLLCCMVQIRHLKYLAPFSIVANILMFVAFAICLYYIFSDTLNVSDKRLVGDIDRFPAYLCTVIFAMEGIGVVMPVENEMKQPRHFLGCPGILTTAMTIITVLYITLGLFGYLRYGNELRGSITLNLPVEEMAAVCAKLFVALSIFFSYPLQFYVVVDTFFRFKRHMFGHVPQKYKIILQVLVRIVLVCFCGGIGIAVPYLEQIISLVGALFYSTLGLIIPAVVESVFRWEDLGRFRWVLAKNVILMTLGFFIMVFGSRSAIMDMLKLM